MLMWSSSRTGPDGIIAIFFFKKHQQLQAQQADVSAGKDRDNSGSGRLVSQFYVAYPRMSFLWGILKKATWKVYVILLHYLLSKKVCVYIRRNAIYYILCEQRL